MDESETAGFVWQVSKTNAWQTRNQACTGRSCQKFHGRVHNQKKIIHLAIDSN